jgi:hypothetical protein
VRERRCSSSCTTKAFRRQLINTLTGHQVRKYIFQSIYILFTCSDVGDQGVIIKKFNMDVLGGGSGDLKDLNPFLKVVSAALTRVTLPQAGHQLRVEGGGLERLRLHLVDHKAFFYADTGSGTPLILTLVDSKVVG